MSNDEFILQVTEDIPIEVLFPLMNLNTQLQYFVYFVITSLDKDFITLLNLSIALFPCV